MLVQITKGRFFPTAKCVIGQWHWDGHIDSDHAYIDPVCKIARRISITGKDSNTIAIFMVHCVTQCLFICFGAHRSQDGAENFFLIDIHIGCDMVKQMWAHKKSVFITLKIEIAAIDYQFSALINTALHQTQDILFRGCSHHGAIIYVITCRKGAYFKRLYPWNKFFDQGICRCVANWNGNRNSHAAFARSTVARAD